MGYRYFITEIEGLSVLVVIVDSPLFLESFQGTIINERLKTEYDAEDVIIGFQDDNGEFSFNTDREVLALMDINEETWERGILD